MRRTLIISLIVLFAGSSYIEAQQHPFYSQYMLDKFLVNPAVAGANGITSINLISRQQYVGFENSPQTFALTAQGRLLDDSYILRRMRLRRKDTKKSRSGRVGLGASLYSDRNGIINRTGFQFTYGYHLNMSNRWQLSGGLSLNAYQLRVDDSESYVAQTGDPLLMTGKKSFFVPDASVGVFVTNGSFYSGISMTDLLGSNLKLGRDIYDNYQTLRKYSLIAGYKADINSTLSIEPSLYVQGTATNYVFDISSRLFYMDNYWTGLSYRSNKSIVLMLGARVDRFYLGYAYDISVGNVRTYTSGSHELVFGLRLGDNNTRRFRWFKQDERSFDI